MGTCVATTQITKWIVDRIGEHRRQPDRERYPHRIPETSSVIAGGDAIIVGDAHLDRSALLKQRTHPGIDRRAVDRTSLKVEAVEWPEPSQHIVEFIGVACAAAIDKQLEFEPGDVILAEDAINTADDLQRMLNSNYDVLANVLNGRQQSIAELLTNNMARPYSSLDYTAVWNRETNFFTPTTGGLYTDFYYAIYRANVVVESFDLVEGLDEATKVRLEAESRFVRAVCHWYLVKMWGYPYGYSADNSHLGVPLRLDAVEPPTPRATVGEVYEQVIADLEFARDNLPNENGPYATSMAASDCTVCTRN